MERGSAARKTSVEHGGETRDDFSDGGRLFRNLILARFYLEEKKMSQEETLRILRIRGNDSTIQIFMRGVRAYSGKEARKRLAKLAEADTQLKTGVLPGEIILSLRILSLVQKSRCRFRLTLGEDGETGGQAGHFSRGHVGVIDPSSGGLWTILIELR